MAQTAISRIDLPGKRFFRGTKRKANAKAAAGNAEMELLLIAVTAEVFSVRVVDAGAWEGATVDGEKLHESPTGKPAQLNVTEELKPFTGVTVIWTEPVCPAFRVSEPGESARVKSGFSLMV